MRRGKKNKIDSKLFFIGTTGNQSQNTIEKKNTSKTIKYSNFTGKLWEKSHSTPKSFWNFARIAFILLILYSFWQIVIVIENTYINCVTTYKVLPVNLSFYLNLVYMCKQTNRSNCIHFIFFFLPLISFKCITKGKQEYYNSYCRMPKHWSFICFYVNSIFFTFFSFMCSTLWMWNTFFVLYVFTFSRN